MPLIKDIKSNSEAVLILQAVVDNTVDGFILIDTDGLIQSFNKACETIFGYSASEVVGRNVAILMPNAYRMNHDNYLQHYLDTGEAHIIGIGREVEGLRRNGEVFPLDLSVARVDAGGRTLFSGIIRDVTQRKRAEERVAASRVELERFAFAASHDLKEPLRTIGVFSEVLLADYGDKLDADARVYLTYLTDAAQRLKILISDILQYSQIDAMDMNVKTFDAREQVDLVLDYLSDPIAQANASIRVWSMPTIKVNEIRFSRVLQNLIGNALKYRNPDRRPEIEITAKQKEKYWVFAVSDNGIGIDQVYHELVFEMFRRLPSGGKEAGSGIGLAVCKRIVETWGGEMWLDSSSGKGSTFYFSIPVLPVRAK